MPTKKKCQLSSILVMSMAGLFLSACSTATPATKEVLVINSEPSNANVYLSNGMQGTTPISFTLDKKSCYTIWIEKEGYEPTTVNVDNGMKIEDGGLAMKGNLLFSRVLGSEINFFKNPSAKQLTPNPVFVKLACVTSSEK